MIYKKVEYLLNDLWIVFNGLKGTGIWLGSFEEWIETIRFFHKTRTGGVVLNESQDKNEKGKGVWYVNMYCPGSMPNRMEFKYIMDTVNLMGCKYIAAYTLNNKVAVMLRYFNFDMVENGLFSIACV